MSNNMYSFPDEMFGGFSLKQRQSVATMSDAFTLGDWAVEPDRNILSRNARSTAVENKSMDVLVLLASRPGEVLSVDEIVDTIWKGRPMGENPVYKCISNLRNALGDDSRTPKYIETIPRRGYRLIAPVAAIDVGVKVTQGSRLGRRKLAAIVAVTIIVSLGFVATSSRLDGPLPIERVTDVPDNSIAVLPFENLSGDPEHDFFCDGIADELLNRLAAMPALHVVARHSSFSSGGKVDFPAFAKRLGVHYLLSGSVKQSGDVFRINARLLDSSGRLLWSESYDRDMDDIFSLQDDIANAVANGLAVNAGDYFLSEPVQTRNFAAYSAYLLGSELRKRRKAGWGPKAIAAFEKAIRLDPDFAASYAGLAISYLLSQRESPVSMLNADFAIKTALRLNPNLAEAHSAAGLAAMTKGSTSDYRNAEKSLRRAISLNSSLANARGWLSTVLGVLGHHAESIQALEEATSIDPLNPILNANLGRKYHADGRLDAAREQIVGTLLLPDTGAWTWAWVAEVEVDAGRLDNALDWMKNSVNDGVFINDVVRWHAGVVATYYAQLLMADAANQWMETNQMLPGSHWRLSAAYELSVAQQDLGRFEEARSDYEAMVTAQRPLTLLARSLIGRHAVRMGDYDRGIQYLEPIFQEGWALRNAPGGGEDMISTLHFLAVALQRTGQSQKAKRLLEAVLDRQLAARLGHTQILGRFLAQEAITYLLLGERDLAIVRFSDAVAANWIFYYRVPGNPCWDDFRGEAEFESLLADVKQKVALQRERVIAVELLDPFVAPDT